MDNTYYNAIDEMQKAGVDNEYISGWASGYLHNPEREEQQMTEAFAAGYEEGKDRKVDGYKAWLKVA